MVRIKTNVASHRRKKRALKQTKGQFGRRKARYQEAKRAIKRGLAYQYRDRKVRKRQFRSLWIVRINAACQEEGFNYSRFIKGLANAKIEIDRKLIADLAVQSPEAFKKLVQISKDASHKK